MKHSSIEICLEYFRTMMGNHCKYWMVIMVWVSLNKFTNYLSEYTKWIFHVKHDLQDPLGVLENQYEGKNIYDWTGISCGPYGFGVVDLNLSRLKLSGIIYPALDNIQYLQVLYPSSNNMTGHIPPQLGNNIFTTLKSSLFSELSQWYNSSFT